MTGAERAVHRVERRLRGLPVLDDDQVDDDDALGRADARVRRCGWCGSWCYGRRCCAECGTRAPEVDAVG